MNRKALSDKILCLGIDGMDPMVTKRLIEEGKMPNTAKIVARGAQREDLTMLGGVPTITPQCGPPWLLVPTQATMVSPASGTKTMTIWTPWFTLSTPESAKTNYYGTFSLKLARKH